MNKIANFEESRAVGSDLALAKSYMPQALTTFHNHTMCDTNTPVV